MKNILQSRKQEDNETAEKAEESSPRFVLTLPLKTEKWQKDRLDTVFRVCNHLKNALTGRMRKAYGEMTRTRRWKAAQKEKSDTYLKIQNVNKDLNRLKAKKSRREKKGQILPEADSKRLEALEKEKADLSIRNKAAFAVINSMKEEYGFSEYDFHHILTDMRLHYKALIPANVAQKIGSSVWRGFRALFDGQGKDVSFSPEQEFYSIETKSKGDIIFLKEDMTIRFNGMTIPVLSSNAGMTDYEKEALRCDYSYCRIIRKAYPEGWRYMLQIVMKGTPPRKAGQFLGHGPVGNDIGPQTNACVGGSEVLFAKLAEGAQEAEDEIRKLNRAMDRSRRQTNPGMYDDKGRIIRIDRLPENLVIERHGKKRRRWIRSKRYRRLQQKLKFLYRKQRELRIKRHRELINILIHFGDTHYIEEMDWKALAKRSQKTRKKKDGRIASKKRFGRSIATRAPGLFVELYKYKVEFLGGVFCKINTRAARASQYDHTNSTWKKKSLGQRYAHLSNGDTCQRDMYSAFLIGHVNSDLSTYNNDALKQDYPRFKTMQDLEMNRLAALDTKLPSSMGIAK